MKAAYVSALGDADSIRYGELPDPVPLPAQARVRVLAVAVNAVDTFVRSGRWPTAVSFPLVVGRDLVGTIDAVGPGVQRLAPGQLVWTNSAGYDGRPGATAELVAVDQDRLYPLPPDADPVSFVAAAHPGATAHGALIHRARLQAGECVAVAGANGAVGMCLIQTAAAQRAEVIAVIRDPRSADRLRALGATHIVVADAGHAPDAVAEAAGGGIDVFIDASGHIDPADVIEQLNPRGRIILIAGRGRTNLDRWRLYTREAQLLGFIMSAMTASELAAAAHWINHRPADRRLSVSIGSVLRFPDAARAHSMIENSKLPRMPDGTVGRVVLQPSRG
jgi:NADPH:quinone reductase-like Zn-dependent oxidoreductase